MRRITPESAIQKACCDLLDLYHIWWMRINVGAVKIGDRFVRFAKSGTADVICTPMKKYEYCPECEGPSLVVKPLWLEFKSATGRQSEEQKQFQYQVQMAQHEYLLVRDVNELSAWLKENGAI